MAQCPLIPQGEETQPWNQLKKKKTDKVSKDCQGEVIWVSSLRIRFSLFGFFFFLEMELFPFQKKKKKKELFDALNS